MPKRLKKPKKPRRPSDPNRAAHALLHEHMGRVEESGTPPHGDPFREQLSAYMAKLGAKGGKISGAKRMKNLTAEQRQEIAARAARARWGLSSNRRKGSAGS
jgi:hypothetical protein